MNTFIEIDQEAIIRINDIAKVEKSKTSEVLTLYSIDKDRKYNSLYEYTGDTGQVDAEYQKLRVVLLDRSDLAV